MSNTKQELLFGFGARIAEERSRLGYSQTALATLFGKTSRTQGKYESEETAPDLIYLLNLDRLGADIYYIVTGQRSANSLSIEEKELVQDYRTLDTRGKAGVLGMIDGMSAPQQPTTAEFIVHGNVEQQLKGDITVKTS